MISDRELRAKAYELSAGVCRPAEADRLIEDLARRGELVRLKDRSWTTRRLRELEQATVEIAERRANENAAPLSEASLKQARREIGAEIHGSLTQEQREALETITGPGGISQLVGRAGTGKGVVISAAARAWQLEGYEVIGTAVAGATAQRLRDDANLDRSLTVDGLCNGVENGTAQIWDQGASWSSMRPGWPTPSAWPGSPRSPRRRHSKLVLAGDAAQLGSIGAGGLFAELSDRVPTAELSEVHRANHEWERRAWEQVRNGEPGPALAQYQAHDRLHIHDTRAQAAEAMVADWDKTRRSLPGGRAVMITDASNKERDQINAIAQERRAAAGELGSHRVELPGKPYGLAPATKSSSRPSSRSPARSGSRTGSPAPSSMPPATQTGSRSRPTSASPAKCAVDTDQFSDLSLAYAVHVYKAQGITAETSGILTGGWQTDREHAYVALSRAREQTQIYVSREDLGEAGTGYRRDRTARRAHAP